MPRSKSDLSKEVLRKLRKLDAVEEPDGNDDSYVKTVIDDTHENLTARGMAYWTLDAIPEKVFQQLAMYTAAFTGSAFGSKPSDVVEGAKTWPEVEEITERGLRKAIAFPYLGQPVQTEYY